MLEFEGHGDRISAVGLRVSGSHDDFMVITILGLISHILFIGVLFINMRVLRSMRYAQEIRYLKLYLYNIITSR